MPRAGCRDIPNLLQHVIVRGFERRDILLNDDDRSDCMARFQKLLEKAGVECLAWALMSNQSKGWGRGARWYLKGTE